MNGIFNDLSVEADGNRFLYYRQKTRVAPNQAGQLISQAIQAANLFSN